MRRASFALKNPRLTSCLSDQKHLAIYLYTPRKNSNLMYTMFRGAIIICVLLSCQALAQDSTAFQQEVEEVQIIRNFQFKYQQRLDLMRRVYPLALDAKVIVKEHQEELSGISKKRKQKKLGKETHKTLKDEFGYNIRDLYISEGKLLIRLIHRETGMTVAEIIEIFEGKSRSRWYSGLAKLGGQNLEAEYDPEGEDYLTELIIQEIEAGTVPFSFETKYVDKEVFKEGMRDYRKRRKEYHKQIRASKKKKK